MPYRFPHEDLFAWGVGLLTAALGVRMIVARRRSKSTHAADDRLQNRPG